jgi:deoxyribonuclease-4
MAPLRIGLHVRIGGGFERCLETVQALGVNTLQIFTGNPSAWNPGALNATAAGAFGHRLRELDVQPLISHAMYLINLAAANPAFYQKSRVALAGELARAGSYGCAYAVTHIGSHGGEGRTPGLKRIVDGLDFALTQAPNDVVCLLENSAGSGQHVGARFEDLTEILDRLPQHRPRLGIAFDTAHAYASGYDESSAAAMRATLDSLTRAVPPERIRAVHCNDTTVPLGGRADRHCAIGSGNIGLDGFRALLTYPTLRHCAFILETPGDELVEGAANLSALRSLA